MEFFKGVYRDKKLGSQGVFEEKELFIMGVFDSLDYTGLKKGRIIDRFDSAQLIGIINENEMHFVKIYDKSKNSLNINPKTIQYNLTKTKEAIYSGNYIIDPPLPNLPPSGSCTIQKIDDERIAEKIVSESLKCDDEELSNFILKKIFNKIIN